MENPPRAVHARALALSTTRGLVYPPVSFAAAESTVTALLGPARSGRTALMLTLAGRMRPTAGSARVCGHDIARESRAVRRCTALALFDGINDLDDALTAGQHVAERALFHSWHRRVDIPELLGRVGLDGAENTRVGDLDIESRMRLGIALALVQRPRLVLIDDLDHDLELSQQSAIVDLLRSIASDGPAVLFTCVDERTAALADAAVALPALTAEEVADAIA